MPSAMSPNTSSSHLSPRGSSHMHRANSNPFAPLSPDLPENVLRASTQGLSSSPHVKSSRVRSYSRRKLLQIARQCEKRGWQAPADLAPLSTWFGVSSPTKQTQMVDPAIASIGQPGGSSRRGGGGFGEGFGFGGGIGGGGRGIGRGGRNVGLRRQTEGPPNGDKNPTPAGKAAPRAGQRMPEDRGPPRQEGRNEWRKDNYNPGPRIHHDDEAEPAWMDDAAPVPDPAIIPMDPLVHFTPGEDMIAKHKQAMKDRDQGRWRFDAAPQAPVSLAPKVFNSADYLLPNKHVREEAPEIVPQSQAPEPAMASRFQRFFSPVDNQSPTAALSPPPVSQPAKADDHTSRLMGLLALAERAPPEVPNLAPPPPPQQHVQPPYYGAPPAPPHFDRNTPNALLQTLYNPSYATRPAMPPGMMPQPPQPPQMMPYQQQPHLLQQQQHILQQQQQQQQQVPQIHAGYARPPMSFYGPGPPQYQHQIPPSAMPVAPTGGPPGFNRAPAARQQEILHTLFAGLGPGR